MWDANRVVLELENYEGYEILKKTYEPYPKYQIKIWFMKENANIPDGACGDWSDSLESAYRSAFIRMNNKLLGKL
jgi:hypothetical protein